MKCFVTGATGFVGSNLVRELDAQGMQVRALIRPNADLRALKGAYYERIDGDLSGKSALVEALRGCDWCFHVAASYHLWLPDYAPMYEANVQGTKAILEAALEAGCSRIVYTSTVGCVGYPDPTADEIVPSTEDTPASEAQMSNPYKHSKWLGEQAALELARNGAPIVIVNPSAPIGPRDVKPTPTGQVVVDFLNGKLPAYMDTGLNYVHVRDVAWGHILAAEKGGAGQRYILGNLNGNWTMKQFLECMAKLTGLKPPKLKVPFALAYVASGVDECLSKLTKRPPKAPMAGVKMARYKMFFDPSKAVRELGLPQTDPQEAFQDAIQWFKANGYVG